MQMVQRFALVIVALTALQLIDNLVLAEDAVAGSGDPGLAAFAVRRDTPSAGGADGDYVNLSTDSTGALRVTGGGGGTQYAEDAAHTTGDTGTLALVVRRDANTTLVGADGATVTIKLVVENGVSRFVVEKGGQTIPLFGGFDKLFKMMMMMVSPHYMCQNSPTANNI